MVSLWLTLTVTLTRHIKHVVKYLNHTLMVNTFCEENSALCGVNKTANTLIYYSCILYMETEQHRVEGSL